MQHTILHTLLHNVPLHYLQLWIKLIHHTLLHTSIQQPPALSTALDKTDSTHSPTPYTVTLHTPTQPIPRSTHIPKLPPCTATLYTPTQSIISSTHIPTLHPKTATSHIH